MSINPASCHHCIELEAELRRVRTLLGQLLAQTRIAMTNEHVAETAILEFLDPPPEATSGLTAAAGRGIR